MARVASLREQRPSIAPLSGCGWGLARGRAATRQQLPPLIHTQDSVLCFSLDIQGGPCPQPLSLLVFC